MDFNHPEIWPYLAALLVVALVYRRLRRNFGRQPLRPTRMRLRIGILVVLGCAMLPLAAASLRFAGAELLGLAAGAALGLWGARATGFETYGGRLYYRPHTYTGIAVSLLLVGRLVYRFGAFAATGRSGSQTQAAMLQGLQSPGMMRSPLTIALLFVVIGYYVCYYGLMIRRSARISPEDIEVRRTPTGAAR